MIEKRAAATPGMIEVTFVLAHDGADEPIALVGDFNEWDPGSTRLERNGDGRLAVHLEMPTGRRFEFRYRDGRGRYFNDEAADDYADNTLGGANGVVRT
ncbi:isoamylase early set domain-containing protein [soil metagenome]